MLKLGVCQDWRMSWYAVSNWWRMWSGVESGNLWHWQTSCFKSLSNSELKLPNSQIYPYFLSHEICHVLLKLTVVHHKILYNWQSDLAHTGTCFYLLLYLAIMSLYWEFNWFSISTLPSIDKWAHYSYCFWWVFILSPKCTKSITPTFALLFLPLKRTQGKKNMFFTSQSLNQLVFK